MNSLPTKLSLSLYDHTQDFAFSPETVSPLKAFQAPIF